jgi:hypothetical protein
MLLRKEDVEVMGDTGFSSPLECLPRFNRSLEPLQRSVRAVMGELGKSARPRLRVPWDDMADLSARTMVYILAMLGLLHALGQIATGPGS